MNRRRDNEFRPKPAAPKGKQSRAGEGFLPGSCMASIVPAECRRVGPRRSRDQPWPGWGEVPVRRPLLGPNWVRARGGS
jgi:hypothetical protein